MNNTTRTQIPDEVNNFYDRTLLERAKTYFAHLMWAQVRDIPRNNGTDTIKFRRYGELAANTTALSEGVTPSGKQLSVTDVTATVLRYGDYVTITDVVLTETYDPILTETADILGEQAGDTIDQLCRNVIVAGTTVQYADTATSTVTVTSTMKVSRDGFLEAVRTLQGNRARKITKMVSPTDGVSTTALNAAFVAIVSEDTSHDLDSVVGWVPVEKYPSQKTVMKNEVGYVAGVRCVMTTNAKVLSAEGAGGIDVHATLIIAANSYAITRISGEVLRNIIKPLGSAGTADPLDQRTTSGWKASFVAKILNQAWILRYEHAVSS